MKKLKKQHEIKKKKHNKIVTLARSKLNSIESKISEALIIIKLIMKILWQLLMKKEIRELEESIRMINSQKNDAEKINLIKESKRIGIDEVIKRIEFIKSSLKSQTWNNIILW